MASLAAAPFIKVEATKYTEVGYKGAGTHATVLVVVVIVILHCLLLHCVEFLPFLFLYSHSDVDSIIKGLVDNGIKIIKVCRI
jgi:ATP-dependent protease HslVU (ClpYQ) ATPase subunit